MNRLDALETALRVLVEFCDGRAPAGEDMSELQAYAPDLIDYAGDDLAREIVQRTVSPEPPAPNRRL